MVAFAESLLERVSQLLDLRSIVRRAVGAGRRGAHVRRGPGSVKRSGGASVAIGSDESEGDEDRQTPMFCDVVIVLVAMLAGGSVKAVV